MDITWYGFVFCYWLITAIALGVMSIYNFFGGENERKET